MHRILAINPGSTSTKIAVFHGGTRILDETIRHSREELAQYKTILDQKMMRLGLICEALEKNEIPPGLLTAVVGRGGVTPPVDSGTYRVNGRMVEDLESGASLEHASTLGGLIAYELAKDLGLDAYVVDPVVVDELWPKAKLTGIPGIERKTAFHALNSRAVARRFCRETGGEYENMRLVVAHMGGGITVGAHRYGRIVDVNNAVAGEGPFTPERCGEIPASDIIEMCFSGKHTKGEMMGLLSGKGGIVAYLGTNDLREAEAMVKSGDEYAALVLDAMAYQVVKEIGAMCAVLEGQADAIILTGGLAYSESFTGAITKCVGRMAPVVIYPGEDEMLALAEGALRVLEGREQVKQYR